jgi:D-alanyl-D-alanine carboxypeptidase/D-alanyl-D-alanine-endopeptidase (penicillin-binding protein 4)
VRFVGLLVVALALLVAVPTVEAAGPKNRAARASTARAKRVLKSKAKKKLRADKGEIRPDRVPARAKVATGELRGARKPGRRLDAGKLPLSEQIAQQIEELLRGPLRAGTTSLYVAEADTGKTVFSVYPDDPLNPASNVKLIATATALDILGPDYRYLTRLLGQAPDDAGLVDHDLYLLGTYDATLSRANLAAMAQDLAAQGVRQIDGDLVVGGTPTRDGMYRSFVDFKIVAGAPGAPPVVTMDPATDFVQLVVTATTSAKKRVRQGIGLSSKYITDENGHQRMVVTISGQVAAGKTVLRDIWMKEKALHTAHTLRESLRAAGIVVNGDVHVAELRDYLDTSLDQGFIPVPLVDHRSQRLAEIIQRVNKRSTNWLANRVLVTAAARKYGGKPDMATGVKAMYAWLEGHTGLGKKDVVVDNGSGLSYKTELSARQMVAVLRAGLGLGEDDATARDEEIQEAYRASLAIGGVDGTIRGRFKRTTATVLGKTGTLSRVVSLAGLIHVGDRELVFSVITNGHDPSWKKKIRDGQERLVMLLCSYLHRLPLPVDAPEPIEMPADPEPQVTVTVVAGDAGVEDPEDDEDSEDGESAEPAPAP